VVSVLRRDGVAKRDRVAVFLYNGSKFLEIFYDVIRSPERIEVL